MTLHDVSAMTGIDTGNLSRIERGVQSASPAAAEKLAAVFSGSITELEVLYPERYSLPV